MKVIYRSIKADINRRISSATSAGRVIERIELTRAEMRQLQNEMNAPAHHDHFRFPMPLSPEEMQDLCWGGDEAVYAYPRYVEVVCR